MNDKCVVIAKESQPKKRSWWSLDYEMLPYKIHFLVFCGAMSGILPYKTVYAKQKLKLTGTDIAILCTLQQFLVVVAKPAIGAIVDYFNKLKLTIIIISILQALFYSLLLVIPPIENDAHENIPRNIGLDDKNFCTFNKRENLSLFDFSDRDDITFENYFGSKCYLCTIPFYKGHMLAFLSSSINSTAAMYSLLRCCLQPNETARTLYNIKARYVCRNTSDINVSDELLKSYTGTACSALTMSTHNDLILVDISYNTEEFPQCCEDIMNYPNNTADAESSTENSRRSLYSSYQYWLFSSFLILAGLGSNSLFMLSDTACYESLQRSGADYGKQRLWGAVSWGLLAPLSGYLNDLFSTGSEPNYSPGVCMMVILVIVQIINISRLDLVKPNMSRNILKDVKLIFSSTEFVIFVIDAFMVGIFTGFIWFYLMIYLDIIGGSRLLLGMVHACQCYLGEIPLMFLSGVVVKKFGHINTLILTFLAFSVRFLCYSFIQNPWFVLPVECTHGLTYGLFYAAMTSYGKLSARPGTEATTQAVLCSTYEGLGAGVGGLIGGIGFQKIGGRRTYFLASIFSLGAAAFHIMATLLLKTRKKRNEY